ncbi:MAG: ribokinase [Pseudomonadota bacterium]
MITVFGSINIDLIAKVDQFPDPGETVSGNGFETAAGGKGANQALAARRAGASVRMCGAVGDDRFADPALVHLAEAGVGLSEVRRVGAPTGTALIMVERSGENLIAAVPGANGTISAGDADNSIAVMSGGDHLLMQLEIPLTAIAAAMHDARRRGVITLLNIAPFAADAAELAAAADIVVANEREFERLVGGSMLVGADRETALMDLHRRNGQTIIVTLGSEGAVAVREGALSKVPSLAIEPVDTVGAGDTFCGYLAADLDRGHGFETALRRAAVAASLACLNAGAQTSIPFERDVDAAS